MTAPALPPTLLDLAGRTIPLPPLAAATLILVDYQNEYRAGPLALVAVDAAIAAAARLLAAVRAAGGRVIHVVHAGAPGGPFDRTAPRGAIVDPLAPIPGEAVVEKRAGSAFHGTDLADRLPGPGAGTLIVAGFMTHNCVSSTARSAADAGHAVVIAADACATRDLPDRDGTVVAAADLGRAELAGLGDRAARIAAVAEIVAAG